MPNDDFRGSFGTTSMPVNGASHGSPTQTSGIEYYSSTPTNNQLIIHGGPADNILKTVVGSSASASATHNTSIMHGGLLHDQSIMHGGLLHDHGFHSPSSPWNIPVRGGLTVSPSATPVPSAAPSSFTTYVTKMIDFFRYDKNKESSSDVRNTLLVILILIATATYQAILSPPGGLWQDDNLNGTRPHTAGIAILATRSQVGYGMFLFFNSTGFSFSLLMIAFLTNDFPMRLELLMAMLALLTTYDICLVEISPRTTIVNVFIAISIAIPFLIVLATVVVRQLLKCINARDMTKPVMSLPRSNFSLTFSPEVEYLTRTSTPPIH